MTRSDIASGISIACVTIVATFAGLGFANWAAESYLRSNPTVLLTREERINENTRAVREAMIPRDKITLWYDLERPEDLKGLWDEYYAAGAEFESYVHFRSKTLEGRFYGTTDAGYRKVRDQGPWPPTKDNYNIFFFGGSTAFGVGPYWATVASYLQGALSGRGPGGRPIKVYNFGRSGYFTGQEIVLFQRLLTNGYKPDMVIFFDGLNDFCWADGQPSSWQQLAGLFNGVNEAAQRRAAGKGIGPDWSEGQDFFSSLPLVRLLQAWKEHETATPEPKYVAPEKAVEEKPAPKEQLDAIIARYLSTKRQIEGVSHAFEIAPVFVWQPIPTYKYDGHYHLFYPDRLGCHVNSKAGYPMMADRFAGEGGRALATNFIWLADMQENLKEPLYIDAFHYTAPMSRRIAEAIAHEVVERHLVRGD